MKFNCLSSLVSCNAFFQLVFRAMCQAHILLQIFQRASAILLCPTSDHLLAHTLTCVSLLVPTVGVVSFLLQVPCSGQGGRWSWYEYSSKLQGNLHSCMPTTMPQRANQCLPNTWLAPSAKFFSQTCFCMLLARTMTSCVYQLELGDNNYRDSIWRYFSLFLQEQINFVIMMYLL